MSTTENARGITPLRVVIGLAILAALVLGSLWAGGAFSSSGGSETQTIQPDRSVQVSSGDTPPLRPGSWEGFGCDGSATIHHPDGNITLSWLSHDAFTFTVQPGDTVEFQVRQPCQVSPQ